MVVEVGIAELQELKQPPLLAVPSLTGSKEGLEDIVALVRTVAYEDRCPGDGNARHIATVFTFLYEIGKIWWRQPLVESLFARVEGNLVDHHVRIGFQLFSLFGTKALAYASKGMGIDFDVVRRTELQASEVIDILATVLQLHHTVLTVCPRTFPLKVAHNQDMPLVAVLRSEILADEPRFLHGTVFLHLLDFLEGNLFGLTLHALVVVKQLAEDVILGVRRDNHIYFLTGL